MNGNRLRKLRITNFHSVVLLASTLLAPEQEPVETEGSLRIRIPVLLRVPEPVALETDTAREPVEITTDSKLCLRRVATTRMETSITAPTMHRVLVAKT